MQPATKPRVPGFVKRGATPIVIFKIVALRLDFVFVAQYEHFDTGYFGSFEKKKRWKYNS